MPMSSATMSSSVSGSGSGTSVSAGAHATMSPLRLFAVDGGAGGGRSVAVSATPFGVALLASPVAAPIHTLTDLRAYVARTWDESTLVHAGVPAHVAHQIARDAYVFAYPPASSTTTTASPISRVSESSIAAATCLPTLYVLANAADSSSSSSTSLTSPATLKDSAVIDMPSPAAFLAHQRRERARHDLSEDEFIADGIGADDVSPGPTAAGASVRATPTKHAHADGKKKREHGASTLRVPRGSSSHSSHAHGERKESDADATGAAKGKNGHRAGKHGHVNEDEDKNDDDDDDNDDDGEEPSGSSTAEDEMDPLGDELLDHGYTTTDSDASTTTRSSRAAARVADPFRITVIGEPIRVRNRRRRAFRMGAPAPGDKAGTAATSAGAAATAADANDAEDDDEDDDAHDAAAGAASPGPVRGRVRVFNDLESFLRCGYHLTRLDPPALADGGNGATDGDNGHHDHNTNDIGDADDDGALGDADDGGDAESSDEDAHRAGTSNDTADVADVHVTHATAAGDAQQQQRRLRRRSRRAPSASSPTKTTTKPSSSPIWICVENADYDQCEALGAHFDLHPLTIEDCQTRHTREKLEIFQHYLFVVFHALQHESSSSRGSLAHMSHSGRRGRRMTNDHDVMRTIPIKLIVFPNLVLTFAPARMRVLGAVRDRLRRMNHNLVQSTTWLIHAVLDCLTDALLPVVEGTMGESDALEALIYELTGSEHRDLLRRMSLNRRRLTFLRQRLWSKRDILMSLIGKDWQAFLTDVQVPYLRDVYDHVVTMLHKVEASTLMLNSLQTTYLANVSIDISDQSKQSNEIMKNMSAVATIVLPLSLIAGIMGMNVTVPFMTGVDEQTFESLTPFMCICLGMIAVGLTMFLYFRSKRLM